MEPASENVHLDYAHIDNIKLPVTPDVIILPSTLRHFISVCLFSVMNSFLAVPKIYAAEIVDHGNFTLIVFLIVCTCSCTAYCVDIYVSWSHYCDFKDVNGSLAVNPGHLTRLSSGIFYTLLPTLTGQLYVQHLTIFVFQQPIVKFLPFPRLFM